VAVCRRTATNASTVGVPKRIRLRSSSSDRSQIELPKGNTTHFSGDTAGSTQSLASPLLRISRLNLFSWGTTAPAVRPTCVHVSAVSPRKRGNGFLSHHNIVGYCCAQQTLMFLPLIFPDWSKPSSVNSVSRA